jgi:hypothetical protein
MEPWKADARESGMENDIVRARLVDLLMRSAEKTPEDAEQWSPP